MNLYGYEFVREADLMHYGLKGMHWGTRRWQDYSGKFNEAGYQRYFGRGTGKNYHKVSKSARPRGNTENSQSKNDSPNKGSSFDRDKAKKIAKGVAIGAAVVGGTVLVAYGAKKVHDLGGISKVSQDIVAKARETKLENLKLKEEFKSNVASIKSEGKARRAEIGKNTKTEIARIKEDTKTEIARIKEDTKTELARIKEGKANRDQLKWVNSKEGKERLAELGNELAEHEAYLKDVASHPWDFSPSERASALEAVNGSRSYISQLSGTKPKLVDPKGSDFVVHHPEGWYLYERNRLNQGATKEQVYNELRVLGDAKTGAKMPGLVITPTEHGFRERIDMNEARKAIDLAPMPQKHALDIGTTAITGVQSSTVANKTKTAAQIVSEYKKEHPNTTLTPSKIVDNYRGAASTAKSVASSTKTVASTAKSAANPVKSYASSVPKLTLSPDTINAGANFLAQATKSYQTINQINSQNSKSLSKAKQGQKAVDDYTKELLKKSR